MVFSFKYVVRKRLVWQYLAAFLLVLPALSYGQNNPPPVINIIFTSDAHYGITRAKFRGDTGVMSRVVNTAMIRQMNTLPQLSLPADNGIGAGNTIGYIDYVIEGGDITKIGRAHV